MFKFRTGKMGRYHLVFGGKTQSLCHTPAIGVTDISFITSEDISPSVICGECLKQYGKILTRRAELEIVNDNDEREKTDTI